MTNPSRMPIMPEETKKPLLRRNQKDEPPKKRGDGLRRATAKIKARAASKTKSYDFPIKPPELMPGIVPSGETAPVMATDSNPYSFAAQAYPGGGFPGFAYLSQLATRAEYRAFAATLSTEITREWIEFTSKQSDGDSNAEKIKAIEDEFKRLNVRGIIQRAAEHDCYFGRGQIFIEIDGADKKTPLILDPRTVKKGSLSRLSAVEAVWTTPAGYNALDPAAADFYKPSSWFMLGQQVHASRLMTVVTRPLPDILKPAFNFAGMSISQLAEPYVDNWLRTRQSVADLINNFSITALATSMDQVLQGDDDGADVFNRADLFTATRSNLGLMLLDKEHEELLQVNTPLSGLHELQAQSQEHMCLSKGTLVRAKRGWVPIESITIRDEVLTRHGYAPVEWAGVTNYATEFVEIQTESSTLLATEDHPLWSASKNDFVSAKNVGVSHLLRKNPEWESMGSQSLGAGVCGATRAKGTTGIQKLAASCIAFFGKRTLDQSPRGLTCTIETAMELITGWKTWSYCRAQTTPPSMRQRGGDCLLGSLSPFRVSGAENRLSQLFRTALNTVQGLVKRLYTDKNATVQSVRRIKLAAPEPVYNLKVADGFLPEFYANGLLVHNCSVSRMPAIVLTGISPSGLNASSDGEIRIFYDWIAAQQEAFWREPIEVILKCVQLSLFGEIDSDIGFSFVPLYQMTPAEEAEIRAKDGATDCAYIAAGVLDPSEVRDRLAKDPNSGHQGLDAEAEIVLPYNTEEDDGNQIA